MRPTFVGNSCAKTGMDLDLWSHSCLENKENTDEHRKTRIKIQKICVRRPCESVYSFLSVLALARLPLDCLENVQSPRSKVQGRLSATEYWILNTGYWILAAIFIRIGAGWPAVDLF